MSVLKRALWLSTPSQSESSIFCGHGIIEVICACDEMILCWFIKSWLVALVTCVVTSVSSKSSEVVEKDRDCRTRLQGHGRQAHSRATEQIVLIIWEMWSPLVCAFSFGEERARDREISGKTEGVCKGSCRSLSVLLYPPAVCCCNQWASDSHPVLLLLGCHSAAYWCEFRAAQPSTFLFCHWSQAVCPVQFQKWDTPNLNLRKGPGERP